MQIFSVFIILSLATFLTILDSSAQNNWTFVKETYIKGNINGTVDMGFLFKVSSSEFYVVNERNRQRVRERNPQVKIYQNGSHYLLDIEGFDEPVLCLKVRNVVESQINGEFKGWEGETIFKLMNGQIWQQASYAYMYQYAYNPEVFIYEYRGSFWMKVEDVDEILEVKKLVTNNYQNSKDVIETRIDGDFEGWDGETIFKLQNGQIWQQSSYSYYYYYAYSPKVIIYKVTGGYEMQVEGVAQRIKVTRLK